MSLNPKQEKFAELYLELGNATEAYRQAYEIKETTKNETVHVRASTLLNSDKLQRRIQELQKNLQEKHEITREWVINRYLDIINTHLGYKDRLAIDGKLSGKDKEKIYAMSNSGYIKGSDVNTALKELARLLGLDKEEEKKQEANVINNIQINIKRDRE